MTAGPPFVWVASIAANIAVGMAMLTFAVLPASVFTTSDSPGSETFRLFLHVFRVWGAGIFGLVFVVVWVVLLVVTFRNRMVFDRRAGVLRLKRNRGKPGGKVSPRDLAAVQLLACGGSESLEINLVFARPAGNRLMVTYGAHEETMRSHAEKLAAFLGVPLVDHTRGPATVSGRVIEVEKRLIPGWSVYRNLRLSSGRSGRMVLKPMLQQRMLQLVFMGAGLLAITLGILTAVPGPTAGPADTSPLVRVGGAVFACLVGLALVLVGLTVLSASRIVFDRVAGTIRGSRLKTGRRPFRRIPLRNVCAIQVCGEGASGVLGDEGSVFQINLVLHEPAGARVPLVEHGRESVLRADAQRLAEFLGVPLLDHVGEARSV